MRHLRLAVLAGLALAVTAPAASAQRAVNTGGGMMSSMWEWGVDFIGLSVGGDPSSTSLGFGSGSVRAGRFVRENLSFEPVLGFNWFSTDNFSSNNLDIELGVLWHLSTDRTMQQIYIRPALGMNRSASEITSGGSTTSSSQTCNRVMVGAGVKRPSKKMPKIHWRGEARFTNYMECGSAAAESFFSLVAGFSIFTP